ncbi:MAG: aminotransferase class I/II-fold pyridoxal phosphate-dependent enzyme [Deltaproteobacteria bacterium]|nr:aminotransferase class I/II-fold pyridoxal phosphate-dependent enzyme [Deltaproteobacteria bacterium]
MRKVYDLSVAYNPFGPSKRVKNALRKAIKLLNTGIEREKGLLRKYIAMKEGIKEEFICFFQSLPFFLKSFCEVYSIGSIGFFRPLSKRLQIVLEIFCKAVNGGVRVELLDVEKGLDSIPSGLDLLFLVYPHDVLGLRAPLNIGEIIDGARTRGLKVVLDETFKEFSTLKSPTPQQVVNSGEIMLIRSFSEFYGLGGIKLFCLFANERAMEDIKRYLMFEEISYLTYVAVRAGLKDKKFRERTTELIKEEKDYLKNKAKNMSEITVEDTGLNFLLIKGPHLEKTEELLKRNDIIVQSYIDEREGFYLWLPVNKRRMNALFIKTLAKLIEQNKG